jgi:hypothetical protein
MIEADLSCVRRAALIDRAAADIPQGFLNRIAGSDSCQLLTGERFRPAQVPVNWVRFVKFRFSSTIDMVAPIHHFHFTIYSTYCVQYQAAFF